MTATGRTGTAGQKALITIGPISISISTVTVSATVLWGLRSVESA